MKKLLDVQSELKAPKGQWNDFSKFHYRSAEDIVEAAKPILRKHGLVLTLSDELVGVEAWHYVKATATVWDAETGTCIASTTGFAREQETKKGMDSSQITGSCSSYARKYALNGLFAIDDGKDADGHDNKAEGQRPDQNPAQQADDDKPWYNDFEQHREMMLGKISTGESTAQEIITNLRKQYKVSRKVADQITQLESAA